MIFKLKIISVKKKKKKPYNEMKIIKEKKTIWSNIKMLIKTTC